MLAVQFYTILNMINTVATTLGMMSSTEVEVQPRKRKTKMAMDDPKPKQRKISIPNASLNQFDVSSPISAAAQMRASLEQTKIQFLNLMRLQVCNFPGPLRTSSSFVIATPPCMSGLLRQTVKQLAVRVSRIDALCLQGDKGNLKTAGKYKNMWPDDPVTQFTTLPMLPRQHSLPELQQLDSMCGKRRNMSLGILSDISTSRIAKAETDNYTPFSFQVQRVVYIDIYS